MPDNDTITRRVLMRRMFMGALASAVFGLMVLVAYGFGAIERGAMILAEILVMMLVAGYYGVVLLGWNERFKDPSLTLPLILAASTVNAVVLFLAQHTRGAFMLVYFLIMFCGVFRLSTRQLLGVAAFQLISFGGVLLLLDAMVPFRPDLRLEVMQWLMLAPALVWFAYMGGYINRLVTRLGESEFDELTGAYARRRIIEIFRHEKRRTDRSAGPFCICLVDIDRLKSVNDQHGHQGGDRHLKLVVTAVQHELRNIDYIGRYGGDEFLVILTETSLPGALECAERIRQTLKNMSLRDQAESVTVSIGVAQYLRDEGINQTLSRADAALYAAKNRGRDRVEYDSPAAMTSPQA